MRRARLRNSVNLASAQNRRRPLTTATATGTQHETKEENATTSDTQVEEGHPPFDEGGAKDATNAATNPMVGDVLRGTENLAQYVVSNGDRGSDSERAVVASTSKDINNVGKETPETDNKNFEQSKTIGQIKEGNDDSTASSVPASKQEDTATKMEASAKEKSISTGGSGTSSGIEPWFKAKPLPHPRGNFGGVISPINRCTDTDTKFSGLRLGRNRFRPNLSLESTQRNRLRRISGSLGGSADILHNSPNILTGLAHRPHHHRIRTFSNRYVAALSQLENGLGHPGKLKGGVDVSITRKLNLNLFAAQLQAIRNRLLLHICHPNHPPLRLLPSQSLLIQNVSSLHYLQHIRRHRPQIKRGILQKMHSQ